MGVRRFSSLIAFRCASKPELFTKFRISSTTAQADKVDRLTVLRRLERTGMPTRQAGVLKSAIRGRSQECLLEKIDFRFEKFRLEMTAQNMELMAQIDKLASDFTSELAKTNANRKALQYFLSAITSFMAVVVVQAVKNVEFRWEGEGNKGTG